MVNTLSTFKCLKRFIGGRSSSVPAAAVLHFAYYESCYACSHFINLTLLFQVRKEARNRSRTGLRLTRAVFYTAKTVTALVTCQR